MAASAGVGHQRLTGLAAILEYSRLLGAYPAFIMPAARLPLAKPGMKTVLRAAWQAAADEGERETLATLYACLALFRDDVTEPLDPWLTNADPADRPELSERYQRLSSLISAEIYQLRLEWDAYRWQDVL